SALRRRPRSGRGGLGAQHHREGTRRLEQKGRVRFPGERRHAGRRQRRWRNGTCDQEHFAAQARRPRRDRGISEIAAAGRGTQAAAEEEKEGWLNTSCELQSSDRAVSAVFSAPSWQRAAPTSPSSRVALT